MTTGYVERKIHEIKERIASNERDLDMGIMRYGDEPSNREFPSVMEDYENSVSDTNSRSSAAI